LNAKYIIGFSNHLREPGIVGKVFHTEMELVFKVVHAQVVKFHDKFREAESIDDMIQLHDEQ